MNNVERYIKIGYCSKGHGVKGAFTFNLESGNESILSEGMQVHLVPEKGSQMAEPALYEIENINYGHKVMAFLKGVHSLSDVESMVPFSIELSRDQFPELDENEVYLSDLIGFSVRDMSSGQLIGHLSRIYSNGPQDVLVISAKPSFEIPFIDHFVTNVDLEKREITVVVPQYIS